jgi:hypothetical protein
VLILLTLQWPSNVHHIASYHSHPGALKGCTLSLRIHLFKFVFLNKLYSALVNFPMSQNPLARYEDLIYVLCNLYLSSEILAVTMFHIQVNTALLLSVR